MKFVQSEAFLTFNPCAFSFAFPTESFGEKMGKGKTMLFLRWDFSGIDSRGK